MFLKRNTWKISGRLFQIMALESEKMLSLTISQIIAHLYAPDMSYMSEGA